MKKVKFLGEDCTIEFSKYLMKQEGHDEGQTVIQLVCPNGEPMAVATVNIPEYPLNDGYVLIKNWSENEGIYGALRDAEIIGPQVGRLPTGYVDALICPLLIDPEDEA